MFTEEDIKAFWCCLHPTEKSSLEYLYSSAVPPQFYVVKASAEIIFTATGLNTPLSRKNALITEWGFTEGEVDIPGIGETEVYAWSLPQYLEFGIFAVNVGFTCAEKCKILRYSG